MDQKHYIFGNTYSHRKTLSDAGCKWDAHKKGWWTADETIYHDCLKIVGLPTKSTHMRPTGFREVWTR